MSLVLNRFNLLSDAMVEEAACWQTGTPGRWLWSCANAFSVPASALRLPAFAVAAERSAARGWPVVIRRTGGGCVPQGPGILNLGIATHSSGSADALYSRVADCVIAAAASLGCEASVFTPEGAWCEGRYDISAARRKFCGLSQRRSVGTHVRTAFIHAAILLEANLDPAFAAMRRFLTEAGADTLPSRAAATTLADAIDAPSAPLEARFTESLAQQVDEAFG